jgi:hypothetical protein
LERATSPSRDWRRPQTFPITKPDEYLSALLSRSYEVSNLNNKFLFLAVPSKAEVSVPPGSTMGKKDWGGTHVEYGVRTNLFRTRRVSIRNDTTDDISRLEVPNVSLTLRLEDQTLAIIFRRAVRSGTSVESCYSHDISNTRVYRSHDHIVKEGCNS